MRTLLLVSFAVIFLAGCGVGSPICAGTSCDCTIGNCSFDGCNSSTTSCRYDCGPNTTCTGTCGPDCRINCQGTSCSHSAGPGSHVECVHGDCNITCNGTCTAEGSQGMLHLTCVGSTMGPTGCE
ncbi:MAG: hypothetical protein QM723_01575 [Myxococcaceae bacterium]